MVRAFDAHTICQIHGALYAAAIAVRGIPLVLGVAAEVHKTLVRLRTVNAILCKPALGL